ncbi:MAG: ABC-2 family transporter protein [Chloroflexota bacterium]|nr:ABC-2 family transporter protein [Chloroflexota bacterium]
MRPILRKARAIFASRFSLMSAYRAEIIIWMLSGTVPLIMMAVWIGKAQTNGGAVGGFTPRDFAAYFLAAWLSQQLVVAWVSWALDDHIRQGTLSPKLMRPLDVVWEFLTEHVAERVVRLPFVFLILTVGMLLVPGTHITPDLQHALAYVPCIGLAFAIRFLIAYCIGLLAFWFDQAIAIDEFYFVISVFLSGGFAPLEFYPPVVRALVEWTPFPYVIYPCDLTVWRLSGIVSGRRLLFGGTIPPL